MLAWHINKFNLARITYTYKTANLISLAHICVRDIISTASELYN